MRKLVKIRKFISIIANYYILGTTKSQGIIRMVVVAIVVAIVVVATIFLTFSFF